MEHGHQGKPLTDECLPADDKEPAWLKDFKDPKEREALINTQMYKDWRATTTTLCSDLRWSQRDNAKVYPSRNDYLPWRTDRLPLFRGGGGTLGGKVIGRSPEYIFNNGFVPWDPTSTGSMSIPSGSRKMQTALINTGYNPSVGFGFGAPDGQIFVIDAPGGINQSKLETPHINKNVIVFPGGIQARFIKGCFYRLPDEKGQVTRSGTVSFMFNPNYLGNKPGADEIDVIIINAVDPEARLTHTPARYSDHIVARFKKNDIVTLYPVYTSNEVKRHEWSINDQPRGASSNAGELTLTEEDKAHNVICVEYSAVMTSTYGYRHAQPTPELKSIDKDVVKVEWPRMTMVEFYHAAVWVGDHYHGFPEYTARTVEAVDDKMVATFINLPSGTHTVLVSAWGNAAENSEPGSVTINIP